MKARSRTALRRKLMSVNLFSVEGAFFLAALFLIAQQFYEFRNSVTKAVTAHGSIVASNSTAALMFEDSKNAAETLNGLKEAREVVRAVLFNKTGKLLARFSRDGKTSDVPALRADGAFFENGSLILFKSVEMDGEKVGTLYMEADLKQFYARLLVQVLVLAAILATSLIVAFAVLSKMQNKITEPIFDLLKVMEQVSKDRNYSKRARIHEVDELGSLAEDVDMNVLLVQQIFKRFFGIVIDVAPNGIEAVDASGKENYDVIFMDIQMPKMDGITAAAEIRKNGSKVPIFAMSANVFAEDMERAKIAGMNDFVTKPVKREAIEKALDTALLIKNHLAEISVVT